jgi:cyanophycinase
MAKNNSEQTNGNSPSSDTQLDATPCSPKGMLVVIGGHEKKEGHRPILELLAKQVGSGKLVVATLASEEPQSQWQDYERSFRELGVSRIEQLNVQRREELLTDPRLKVLDDARVLFFAGGDQMKITTKFGGTLLCDRMREMYQQGATIAGTSSGASVMTEVMMAAGDGDTSHEVGGELRLAPGLGLVSGIIIDQHFAERGRMGRLLGAVAQNPRLLGVGIDENTALVLDGHREGSVIGSGAVYVIDGREITYTNVAEGQQQTMSAFGVKVHVLSRGDRFDLTHRRPVAGDGASVEHELIHH